MNRTEKIVQPKFIFKISGGQTVLSRPRVQVSLKKIPLVQAIS